MRNYRKLLMNLTFLNPTGLLVLCILLVLPGVVYAQTPHFDELKQKFEDGQIFHATFTHEYRDSYTGEESRSQGEIWIGSGDYKVESEDQIMVVDGEISRVYDGIRNRLLISEYDEEEDDFAPSRMLQGVDETYRVEESANSSETLITLISDDPFAIFTIVEISLDQDGNPIEIQAVDQVDNVLVTMFQSGRFIQETPDLFEMTIPENAERIDLRH